MELKKTSKADLENKRNLFVQMGLVISFGVVLTAFNVNDSVKSANTLGELTSLYVEDDGILSTKDETPPPPPPPPPPLITDMLIVVGDKVDLDDDFELGSTEATNKTLIYAVPTIPSETPPDEEKVFVVAQEMPEFPGGEPALLKWLSYNVIYPAIALNNGVQGKVYVSFVVDCDGSIINAYIPRSGDSYLDEEALRVVNKLPKWKPGKQRGKPVKVSFTVPINFQIQ